MMKQIQEDSVSFKNPMNSPTVNTNKLNHWSSKRAKKKVTRIELINIIKMCLNCKPALAFMLKTCKSDHLELR